MKKIKHFMLLICSVFCVVLCGCQENTEKEKIQITIVSGWGGNFESHIIMREIYEGFEKENEDIKFNYIYYADNVIAVKKAIDMMALGNTPDIVSTNGLSYYLEHAVKSGVALDLMPYIESDIEWKKQIHPKVFEIWKTKAGELYTLQDALEISGYWYNAEYLKKAGIEKLPDTWEEFLEMISKVYEWSLAQEEIEVYALEKDQIKNSLFWPRVAGMEFDIDSQVLKNAVADINVLKKYSTDAINIEQARNMFVEGKSVFYFCGVWDSYELQKSEWKEHFQYAAYPTESGKSLGIVSASSGYVVAAQDDEKKVDACLRFLKYITREEIQEKIALMTNQAPSNPNVDIEKIKRERPLLGKALEVINQSEIQIPTIYSSWTQKQIEEIEKRIYKD